jgi:cell division topological specificity factor
MNLFKKLMNSMGTGRQSAKVARERLQIVLSHQRSEGSDIDFLPKLRHELLAVICKYVQIDQDQINVQLQKTENRSVLELNITLPASQ